MWVVKFGGSLAHSENLRRWLDVIATAGAGKVVLVPGGGPFADAVREAQQQIEFDDHTAHRMALLAMEQYGLCLCGSQTGLVPAGSTATIRDALEKEEVPVWMPSTLVLGDPSIPESWDVTADSLA
ncbi:MAG: aspartate kinase, partial [Burkholderiales bacterium]